MSASGTLCSAAQPTGEQQSPVCTPVRPAAYWLQHLTTVPLRFSQRCCCRLAYDDMPTGKNYRSFEGSSAFTFKVKQPLSWDCLTHEGEGSRILRNVRNHPPECHIAEDLNPVRHRCENLKCRSCFYWLFIAYEQLGIFLQTLQKAT